MVTKPVMPERVSQDLCRQSAIGQDLLNDFVSSRINTNATNLWAPMKKSELQTWKSTGKRIKVTVDQKVFEFKEDRSLSCASRVCPRTMKHVMEHMIMMAT